MVGVGCGGVAGFKPTEAGAELAVADGGAGTPYSRIRT
jgi:hypothetical protein